MPLYVDKGFFIKILFSMFLLLFFCADLFGINYKVDSQHSYVGFQVRYMLASHVKGKFLQYAGILSFDEDTKQLSWLIGTIDVSSVNTNNDARDTYLLSEDFFDIKT